MSTQRIARRQAPLTPRYGWLSALGALLAGSIAVYVALFALEIVLGAVLHVLPAGGSAGPGTGVGWPWRIDGAWAGLADLGPLLVSAVLIAVVIASFVEGHARRPTARWPIALCAVLVGWVPIAQNGRDGLLGVSGGLAFVAMWWTTHRTAEMPRPRRPLANRPRLAVAAAGATIVGLLGASVSYGALHPVELDVSTSPETATLQNGTTGRFPISIDNEGPLPIRLRAISLSHSPDLRVIRLERPGPRTEGPTIDSLYSPAGTPRIAPGGDVQLWLTLGGSPGCLEMDESLQTLDVHLTVGGLDRTQQVHLGPGALEVNCRPSRRP